MLCYKLSLEFVLRIESGHCGISEFRVMQARPTKQNDRFVVCLLLDMLVCVMAHAFPHIILCFLRRWLLLL